jgi:hypothetical protein
MLRVMLLITTIDISSTLVNILRYLSYSEYLEHDLIPEEKLLDMYALRRLPPLKNFY